MHRILTFTAVLVLVATQAARTVAARPVVRWSETGGKASGQKPVDPKLVAKLAAQLGSKDYEERSAALAELAKLLAANKGAEAAFGPVIEPLFSHAGWGGIARRNARLAEDSLVRIGMPALPLLKQRLKSDDAHDRRVAAELLVRIGPLDASMAALLRPLLADRDGYVRRAAIEGLGTVGAPAKEAIGDLEAAATIELDHVRRVSVRVALIRIAGASEERVRALAGLLEPMTYIDEPMTKGRKTGLDYDAARFAASELGKLGLEANASTRKLLAALKHTDAGIRVNAAAALGDVGATSPETVAALIDLLKNDPQKEARRSAASSLGKIGPKAKAAIPALRSAMKDDGKGGWWVAAEALGKIGGPEVVPVLVEALTNPDEGVRYTAMKWLGNLGTVAKSAVKALEKASKDDPRELNRTAANDALRRIEQALHKMKEGSQKN